jgi:formamidopyrimidine-DNA glycosylase
VKEKGRNDRENLKKKAKLYAKGRKIKAIRRREKYLLAYHDQGGKYPL